MLRLLGIYIGLMFSVCVYCCILVVVINALPLVFMITIGDLTGCNVLGISTVHRVYGDLWLTSSMHLWVAVLGRLVNRLVVPSCRALFSIV